MLLKTCAPFSKSSLGSVAVDVMVVDIALMIACIGSESKVIVFVNSSGVRRGARRKKTTQRPEYAY